MTDAPAPDAATTDSTDAPSTRYVPGEIEAKWVAEWDARGLFHPEVDDSLEAYTIVVPPPNVTGALHMGHALNGSIQDSLVRFKRMQGYNALWIPGVDHAGIATQAVVEKELRKEGMTRQELGREAFIARVQEWKDEYAETIHGQFRRLGSSMDFERARFTMDDHYAHAVRTAFVQLYEAGHVYRANRLINWDAGTMSAISDLEVVQKELEDEMVEVAYPVVGGAAGEEIVISTARPETIPADVAIAVHPDDDRYRAFVGKHVRVPFTDREIPIIADDYVDIEFGTGALKITPGHDPNDFEIGLRHGLEQLSAINPDRTMSEITGEFAGLGVDAARRAMTDRLEELGVLRSREPYRHSVPHSDRSGVRIEPLISLQWFADMRSLAEPVVKWVDEGKVRFVPDGAKSIFHGWMDDLKPWCLSRQLWWGHQLPVWYHVDDPTNVHVSTDGPPADEADQWVRDEDVLDTWFSSGMWDHATLGWPEQTPELAHFHPTAVLCTARDIINLWVARMMMFSNAHLDEVPFHDVYIHSTIQAPDGRRMSKSLGTGIDPLELFDQYGADATRYGLLDMSSTQDVRFNEGRIKEGNQLANKLWNALRLLQVLGGAELDPDAVDSFDPVDARRLEDRWILARLDRVQREVTRALDAYEFHNVTKALYNFCWNELCDWYLESVKDRLRSEDPATKLEAVTQLAWILHETITLIHPVMPHLSEELSAQLWGEPGPDHCLVAASEWHDHTFEAGVAGDVAEAEARYAGVQALVTRLRNVRQAADIKPRVVVHARLELDDPTSTVWNDVDALLLVLANIEVGAGEPGVEGVALPIDGGSLVLYGLDPAVLKPKLENDLRTARAEAKRAEGKLMNEKFTKRAPAELVQEERDKVERFGREADHLQTVIAQL